MAIVNLTPYNGKYLKVFHNVDTKQIKMKTNLTK